MARYLRYGMPVLLAVLLSAALVTSASAHERRQVGSYVVVVGFENEPAYVEEGNGAIITIFTGDGKPVDGAQKTLKVEVSSGGASKTLDLTPVPGKQGAYVAEFTPTKTGSYAFRFFGKIENTDVNERFESGPNRFDEVVSRAETQFPVQVPSNGELAAQVQALKGGSTAAPAAGTAPAAAVSQQDLQRALDEADSARTTGLIVGGAGIVLAVIGIVLAWTSRSARGRTPAGERGGAEPV